MRLAGDIVACVIRAQSSLVTNNSSCLTDWCHEINEISSLVASIDYSGSEKKDQASIYYGTLLHCMGSIERI